MDRGRGVYVHEADKESKNELEGGKWTGGSFKEGREWTGGRLWSLARIKSNNKWAPSIDVSLHSHLEKILFKD